ncbi:histidine kinase [Gordonia sp. TBRC 11910]|uniref:Histidine kinase n=1 Tax=Gordonia asplenii TaxID=2725283 RepID=A0A848KRK8_9ACTN|nr:histidine kinase [Gordonia asplenii]NMO00719.1 histidine kinase [Gordonia asplenii]
MSPQVAVALIIMALVTIGVIDVVVRTRRVVTTPTERAVHDTLQTAALAARSLRAGLSPQSAADAVPHLRELTGASAVAVYDADVALLAAESADSVLPDHVVRVFDDAAHSAHDGGRRVLKTVSPASTLRSVIAQPLIADEQTVGVLIVATAQEPGPGLLGAVAEVARYVSSQLELAELDASRSRLDRAEVLALRAQISPHFIYNALNTIASFVRTDPDRARELILDFADFTRYSFRAAGEYTLLADELRNIDRYLTLERARFGSTLTVKLQIAPEVLNVVLPFLALQPLVENAVRHGLAGRRSGTITITAVDAGSDCVISVEDDGVGMDPELLRTGDIDALTPPQRPVSDDAGAHVGLTNVDHRLRAAFGNDYGLIVETAPGAGTKVGMRVPKFRPGVAV